MNCPAGRTSFAGTVFQEKTLFDSDWSWDQVGEALQSDEYQAQNGASVVLSGDGSVMAVRMSRLESGIVRVLRKRQIRMDTDWRRFNG